MSPVSVDQKYLEYLFESRGRESVMKMENNKIQVILTSLSGQYLVNIINTCLFSKYSLFQAGPVKEIVVLDNKRSNFINIGMTKFPPPR